MATLLVGLVPLPTSRNAITWRIFISDCVPPLILYFVSAFLCLIPDTFPIRFGLLPILLWSIFRAATSVDLTWGAHEYCYLNEGLCLAAMIMAMRSLGWTFRREPLRRGKVPSSDKEGNTQPPSTTQLVLDTLDLGFNLRGLGWCWSEGLHVPKDPRPTTIGPFVAATFLSLLKNILWLDTLHHSLQSLAPNTFGSVLGGTIYDASLNPALRYLRSNAIACLGGFSIYAILDIFYDLATLIGVLLLRQSPSQWPPLFDAPWRADSLAEFWSKRWHQLFRICFVTLGVKPVYLLTGSRAASVMGAFLVSALLHDWATWGLGRGTEFRTLGGFFILHGIAVLAEGFLKKVAGLRVGGRAGNAWVVLFTICTGQLLIDACARKGLIGARLMPESLRPGKFWMTKAYGLLTHLEAIRA